ncbi:hypothetical protein M1771_01935 [Spiroplasma citri]|uniref:Uncharacterized protein n=1 Tax=Spiroplasma citri TaxID=2133 RepID=A0AAX3T074_SPICI|nr:hypothetical protein [Spiroplasma citri]WFG96795.1 hypothetical protein M0C40_01945 [Spiroplasma citri]WFH00692.1 hypothetical protein M1771_01935 [Spiroplasma citri]
MLLCHDEQTSKEYQQCLANFKKLLKKYANKKILIISLPDSNKEILLEKIFDNNEFFEKAKGIFFAREKIYRYNNIEFIDTVPITGINFSQLNVYWNTQILGLFKIEDNTEIVAIKALQLLLTKYQKK